MEVSFLAYYNNGTRLSSPRGSRVTKRKTAAFIQGTNVYDHNIKMINVFTRMDLTVYKIIAGQQLTICLHEWRSFPIKEAKVCIL